MGFDVKEWFSQMQEGDVFLSYKGDFTSDLITNALEVIESKLSDFEQNPKAIKTLYNVIVECLQNLYHHSLGNVNDPESSKGRFGYFVFTKIKDSYRVVTGNYVDTARIQILKDRIDQINSLTKDELKGLYKLILNNEEFSEKGGGGLGMIDIARKTGSKLEYTFSDNGKDSAFYGLIINISNLNN